MLLERHTLGSSQLRVGPVKVGYIGELQTIIDGLKLIGKELVIITNSYYEGFYFVSIFSFLVIILHFFRVYYNYSFISDNYLVIYYYCLIGLSVYPLVLIGLMRKSKYSFIGSIRAARQSISYEIVLRRVILIVVSVLKQFNFQEEFCVALLLSLVIF